MLAQSGFSFLIYLVIGIFWLVGQVVQQKQAKQKAEEMRKRREEREGRERQTGKKEPETKRNTIERELEDFLGRLTGEPATPPPPPPPQQQTARPEAPVLRKGTRPKPPPPPIQFDTPPPPALDSVPEPPKEIASKSRIRELDYNKSITDIADMKEAKEIIGDLMEQDVKHEALQDVRAMMIDLSDTQIKMPSIKMMSIRPVPTQTSRPDLQKRDAFRKALVSSFILEPPKALQPDPFKGTD